jgi:hypothetical protein
MGLNSLCKNRDTRRLGISEKSSTLKATPNSHTKVHFAYKKLEHHYPMNILNM